MESGTTYIVQFVGFKTDLEESDFIKSWMPFASSFKSSGIDTIDLYAVDGNENINFISRNIWEEQNYFKNFPTGIAGSGGGGGISVIQFGGYRLEANQLDRKDEMRLAFIPDPIEVHDTKTVSRLSVSDKGTYRQFLEITEPHTLDMPHNALELTCNHVMTI